MNKKWEIDERLLDSGNGQLKACFDFGSKKILDDGKLRFELILRTEVGDFTLRGLRYDTLLRGGREILRYLQRRPR